MKRYLALTLVALLLLAVPASAQRAAHQVANSSTSGATITLAAPPAGQFIYLTGIDIQNCAGASAVAAANPGFITTTNITGSPKYMVGSGTTAGNCAQTMPIAQTGYLRSAAAGTAVTFVLPTFLTNQTLNVNVYFFYGPAF